MGLQLNNCTFIPALRVIFSQTDVYANLASMATCNQFAGVCSVFSEEDSGRFHYTSEGRHIRIFVQLLSSIEESDLDLPTYFSRNGAFIVKYEGMRYLIVYIMTITTV